MCVNLRKRGGGVFFCFFVFFGGGGVKKIGEDRGGLENTYLP